MTPPPARQVAVLADLCDAVDPRLSAGQRHDALGRAGRASPLLALAGLATNLHWLLNFIRDEVGEQALAQVMAELRANAGSVPDLFGDRP